MLVLGLNPIRKYMHVSDFFFVGLCTKEISSRPLSTSTVWYCEHHLQFIQQTCGEPEILGAAYCLRAGARRARHIDLALKRHTTNFSAVQDPTKQQPRKPFIVVALNVLEQC